MNLALILELVRALPKLIALAEQLGAALKEANTNAYLDDLYKVMVQLNEAKSPDDKRKAAQGLVDLARRM